MRCAGHPANGQFMRKHYLLCIIGLLSLIYLIELSSSLIPAPEWETIGIGCEALVNEDEVRLNFNVGKMTRLRGFLVEVPVREVGHRRISVVVNQFGVKDRQEYPFSNKASTRNLDTPRPKGTTRFSLLEDGDEGKSVIKTPEAEFIVKILNLNGKGVVNIHWIGPGKTWQKNIVTYNRR